MYNNFEISLVVNITTNHDITYTNFTCDLKFLCIAFSIPKILGFLSLRKIPMERPCRNHILHRKKNYNKSNILRLATQYSLNLFVKRHNVIVNRYCWIIKHPCRLRINLCRSRKVLPVRHAIKKLLSIIAWENIYVDITFKGSAIDFPGWC